MKILANTSRGQIVCKSVCECLRLFGIPRVNLLMKHIEIGNAFRWCGLRVYFDVQEDADEEGESKRGKFLTDEITARKPDVLPSEEERLWERR